VLRTLNFTNPSKALSPNTRTIRYEVRVFAVHPPAGLCDRMRCVRAGEWSHHPSHLNAHFVRAALAPVRSLRRASRSTTPLGGAEGRAHPLHCISMDAPWPRTVRRAGGGAGARTRPRSRRAPYPYHHNCIPVSE
jgi:hypothetical protein